MMYAVGQRNKVGKRIGLKLTRRKVDDVSLGCSFDRANDACGLLMRIQTCKQHQNGAEVRTYCVRRGPLCREKERCISSTCEKRMSSIILTHMHISEGIEKACVPLDKSLKVSACTTFHDFDD